MTENRLLLRKIEDKIERFLRYYTPMSSDFLSMEEQSRVAPVIRKYANEGVFFWGGFPQAERKMILFMPDYTGIGCEEDTFSPGKGNFTGDDCPAVAVEITTAPLDRGKLSHRDYLGAILAEGITRAKVGDIIVREQGAIVIATREMGTYLKENLTTVGRCEVKCRIKPLEEIKFEDAGTTLQKFTVSSPRVDNILVVGFGISRKNAVDAVGSGKVFIDDIQISKPDMQLRGDEKVVLRGKGKFIYRGETGLSRKGKHYIQIEKYM